MSSPNEPYIDFKEKEMVCPFCGKREMLLLPAPVSSMASMMKQFERAHADCERIDKRQPVAENHAN